jgi:6-phosphogluconolactonase
VTGEIRKVLASRRAALFYFRMKILNSVGARLCAKRQPHRLAGVLRLVFDTAGLQTIRTTFACALALLVGCASHQRAEGATTPRNTKDFLVYLGTYTGGKSKGIYVSHFDSVTGKLGAPELAAESVSPSFLVIHPNQRFLYAANETGEFAGKKSGAVSAFAIDSHSGKLTPVNQQPSGGDGPCHVAVDKSGKTLLVANYGGGSVEALPIKPDGTLDAPASFIQHRGSSVDKQRQEGPHGHFITTDAANRFALACDLGLDKIVVYKFDPANSSLVANDPPAASVVPGSGPRHLAFHPNGRFAYVINEMKCTMTAFAYDPERGELKELQNLSTLPEGETVKPNYSTAEVEAHPSGRFLYGSNRGHDSIVVYATDPATGKLAYIENVSTQGKTPRGFGIDPTGSHLLAANQDSENVVVLRIDQNTGRLSSTGTRIEVGKPVCVVFVPLGKEK